MRMLASGMIICLCSVACAQIPGPPMVTHDGAVTTEHWSFNSPQVGPGMLYPEPTSGAGTGVFYPSPEATYFSEPIPDGSAQVGFDEGPGSVNSSGGFLLLLGTIQPGSPSETFHFTVAVGNSMPLPDGQLPGNANGFAGYLLTLRISTPGGPLELKQVASSDLIAPGSFETATLDYTFPASPSGAFPFNVTLGVAGMPQIGRPSPLISFFDNPTVVIGPPGQVPEPSLGTPLLLAGIGRLLVRSRHSSRFATLVR